MSDQIALQLEDLDRLSINTVVGGWARRGDWWYHKSETTGELSRARVVESDKWKLTFSEEKALNRVSVSISPQSMFASEDILAYDYSACGQFICVILKDNISNNCKVRLVDLNSREILLERAINTSRITRIFVSHSGKILYYLASEDRQSGKNLWGLSLWELDQSPMPLLRVRPEDRLICNRTSSLDYLKVVHVASDSKRLYWVDLTSITISDCVELYSNQGEGYFFAEHILCDGTNFSMVINFSGHDALTAVQFVNLDTKQAFAIKGKAIDDWRKSFGQVTKIFAYQSCLVTVCKVNLRISLVFCRFKLNENNEVSIEVCANLALPESLEITLLSPLDWASPILDVLISSLVVPPRRISVALQECLKPDGLDSFKRNIARLTADESSIGRVAVLEHVPGAVGGVSIAWPSTVRPVRACVIMGYGCYGRTLSRGFDPLLAFLLENGVAVAVAHVRGGGEFGEMWHLQGARLNKKNSFSDYIDVCRYVKTLGLGHSDDFKIFGFGASAGGLLVAAAANLEPTLFDGLVLIAPFLSPYKSLQNGADPLARSDWMEFGNPLSSSIIDRYIASYSPLENIPSVPFPSAFVAINEFDERVNNKHVFDWCHKVHDLDTTVVIDFRLGAKHDGGFPGERESRARLARWILNNC